MTCEKEIGIEGTFKHNNQALIIIIIADTTVALSILGALTTNLVCFFAIILVLVIGVVLLSNGIKSSYKSDDETIIFMIGHFTKYTIKISDIRHINIQPYTVYKRYSKYRVMLKIRTKEKTYRFNNELDVSKAVDDMLNRDSKPQMADESLTRLYYYIADKRKDLYSENKIDKSI